MEVNIFDIETKPHDEAELLKTLKPFDKQSVKIGNLKDPDKIEAKIEQAEIEYKRQYLDKAALSPHTSSICAIGINKSNSEKITILKGDEASILIDFWEHYKSNNDPWAFWSGSNNREAFDPRHIIVRSWKLGLNVPYGTVRQGGYLTDRFFDLSPVYLFGSPFPSYCSANDCAEQLNLQCCCCGKLLSKKMLKELGVEGKNFHEVLETNHDLALEYLKNDIIIERAIADVIL